LFLNLPNICSKKIQKKHKVITNPKIFKTIDRSEYFNDF